MENGIKKDEARQDGMEKKGAEQNRERKTGRGSGEHRRAVKLCIIWGLAAALFLAAGLAMAYHNGDSAALQTLLQRIEKDRGRECVIGVFGELKSKKALGCYVTLLIDGKHPAGEARRGGCEYLITKGPVDAAELTDTGYQLLETAGNYMLYETLLEEGQWKVTQYGTVSGLQSMCYSLVSEDGRFLMVDGGYDVDAPERRRLAEVFGNRVDVWICSHFHSDHIGAITELLKDPGEIRIGELWCPPMSVEDYRSFAKEWDTIETCESFLQEISGLEHVARLAGGDIRQVGNLSFEILSAYGQGLDWTHEGNNCGFIFKVRGTKESMLFCCDVGNEWMSRVLVDYYGEELRADYVQMGHHGNGGLTREAYEIVAPKVAFFDGPGWLLEDEEKYNAAENRELMESLGSVIYLMDQAPNSVIIK